MNVACSRMYDAGPDVAERWRQLFAVLSERSGVPLEWLTHDGSIRALWSRPDLAAAFMCGRPFARSGAKHRILGAPLPENSGAPVYCSLYVVRGDDPAQRLEEMFGRRIGWMPEHSQSGYAAPRANLLSRFGEIGFAEHAKTLRMPRDCLDALSASDVDIIAIDSFFFDLLLRYDARARTAFRVIDRTPDTPIPPMVARPDLPDNIYTRLREALLALAPESGLSELGLTGFVAAAPETYLAAYADPGTDARTQLLETAKQAIRKGKSHVHGSGN